MNTIYSFTENSGIFRPELPIAITNPKTGKTLITNGLIDTGADVTVFPVNIFHALGIDYVENAESISTVYGVSGEPVKVWIHVMDIMILKENNIDIFKQRLKIAVSCVDSDDSVILLGTNFFTPDFKIRLDHSNKMILLEC